MKTFIRFLLPYVAAVITGLPYNKTLSRFLDQLLVLAEES